MPITPTGAPVWVRTNDHTTYGGHADKVNFQSQGVVDPTTDVSAEQFARLAEDVAALGRVTEFAVITAQFNDTSPAAPTLSFTEQLAGADPTPTRNGTGDATFTWASSYTDAYGVSGAVNIVHAEATVHGATAGASNPEITSGTVVRVRCKDTAGTAISNPKITLTVWTG